MRGWERVGVVNQNNYVVLDCEVGANDILGFGRDGYCLRDEWIRASDSIFRMHGSIATGDIVYRATALGENAFKPRASTPDD